VAETTLYAQPQTYVRVDIYDVFPIIKSSKTDLFSLYRILTH